MKENLTYNFYGHLFVLQQVPNDHKRGTKWFCHCSCGNFVEVYAAALKSGNTKSCGCLQKEAASKQGKTIGGKLKTHGDRRNSNSPYNTWKSMRARCYNSNHKSYNYYGGKGITVCPEWHDYPTFKSWAICNGWHKGLVIDRLDSNKNYTPNNCQWISNEQNSREARLRTLLQ